MAGTVTLAFKLSKDVVKMVKAGEAILSSGGVRLPTGELLELAKPVISSNLPKITGGFGLGPVGGAVNLASSLGSNVQCAFIQKGVNMANVKLDTVIGQLGTLSNALRGLQQIQVLSWVNAAFGLANCGISIAGFQMTLKKLDGVNGQIKEFYDSYKQDRQNDKVEKYHRIYMDLKGHLAFLQELHKEDTFDRQVFSLKESFIEEDLNEAHAFLGTILEDFRFKRIDGKIGCQIIFTLSALYSQVMNEFCCWYYYAHSVQHALFSNWFEIIGEIDSSEFRAAVKEHLSFDLAYVKVSPSQKLDAYKVAFEGIREQKNMLLTCAESIKTLPASEYRQIETAVNQGLIEALSKQLPNLNAAAIDETIKDSISNERYLKEDETSEIIIPIAEV